MASLVLGAAVCAAAGAGEGGPDLAFTGLTTDDGLSQSSVFAVAEDRQGFLWLGTEDGLNRWDGSRFEVYRPGPRDDPEALHGRFVRAIVEDAEGRLWLGTEGGGLARFDPKTETFRNFRHRDGDPASLAEDLILALALDGAGDLWVGTRNRGLSRLRRAAEVGAVAAFEHFGGDPADACALGSGGVKALLVDPQDRLWVGTDDGLYRRRPDGCFERVAADGLVDRRLTHLAPGRDGVLWVSTRGGLYHLDARTGTVRATHLAGEVIFATLEDRDSELWVATASGGLVRFDPESGRRTRYRSRAFDSESLATDVVRCLHEDRSRTLWVGMEQGGVAYVPRLRRRFGRWRGLRTAAGLEQLRSVFALHADDDRRIWVGTRDRGLFALDRTTAEARHWGAGEGRPDALDSSRISALAASGDGRVLVGTVEGGVYRVHPSSGRMERLQVTGGHSVRALLDDGAGGLWVATWGDGLHHRSADGGVRVFRHDPGDPSSLADDVVLCIEPAGPGAPGDALTAVWAGTWSGGLVHLDAASGEARAYRHDPDDPSSLGSDQVAAVRRDRRGRVWVGTAAGLDLLRPGASGFEPIEPFAGTVVFGLLEDGDGHLWASTGRGLWHYDVDAGAARQFRARHGLQGDEYNVGAVASGPGGELLFGGVGGFDAFRPHPEPGAADPFDPGPSPPVALTRLATGRRTVAAGRLRELVRDREILELHPEERTLTVAFAALASADPEHQRFAYRLDGSGADWVDSGHQREARFTRLPPGRHTLQVIAASGAGVWNRDGVTLEILARPAFWDRRTVRAAAVLCGLAGLAAVAGASSRRRLRRLEREREEAVEVRRRLLAAREQERLRLAQELHDGPLQELHALQLAVSRGPRALGDLERDLGSLVADLRSVCTRLRSPVLQLFGLEEAIRDHAETARREHPGVELELDLRLGPPSAGDDLGADLRLALFRVFSEALSNALRHGQPRRIRVALEAADAADRAEGRKPSPSTPGIRLTVADDGCGFTVSEGWIEAARHGHLGILGMAERVDALGGRLDVVSTPGDGTRVVAVVPRPAVPPPATAAAGLERTVDV